MAMIGSSAYAGAVTHTLSSSVLLLELTGDTTYALHVMLATAISFSVARLLSSSIFERTIRLRGLPYVSDLRYLPHVVDAKSIMTDTVVPSLCLLPLSHFHHHHAPITPTTALQSRRGRA